MITHEEEKGREKCFRYWPSPLSDDARYEPKEFIVVNDLKVTFLKQNKVCDDYLIREFLLTNLKLNQQRKIYQYQYLAWSDHGVPENIDNTLHFIENFNKLYQELHNSAKLKCFPITVHCSAGIGRTGAIILIDMILDKIKLFGKQCDIDIYKTVCSLRAQRSGMIQTEKQYQFLYLAIKQYIQALSANSASNQIENEIGRFLKANFNTSTPRTSSLQSISNPET